MRLADGERVISLIIAADGLVLMATVNGFGKCTGISEFRVQGRGGLGVIAIQTNQRNGNVVSALLVASTDEVVLITDAGKLVRTRVAEISVMGRNTQGVRLVSLNDGERLVGLDRLLDEE